jgi:hypothetical protein
MSNNRIKETPQPQTTGSGDNKIVKKAGEFAGRKISILKKSQTFLLCSLIGFWANLVKILFLPSL